MTISGIVAEFNPFHNGHQHIISKMKEQSDCIIAVMSGNYVQRGEPAIFTKYLRAEAALLCGVDLVIELPTPWSTATADYFAYGAVSLLMNAGVNALYFGCESSDINKLTAVAKADKDLVVNTSSNETFAKSRERAISEKLQTDCSDILGNPNNNLAVSYIKAAEAIGARFTLHPIKRIGAAHDSKLIENDICSASFLRENLENGVLLDEFSPSKANTLYKVAMQSGQYLNRNNFKFAAFLKLRAMEDYSHLPDLSEGLENRLAKAVKLCKSYDEVLKFVKTKRYTEARIRRLILSAFLDSDKPSKNRPLPYLNILGMTKCGEAHIKRIADSAKIPLIYSGKASFPLDKEGKILLNKEVIRNNIYSALLHTPRPSYEDFTKGIIKI